jgi:oxygen-independent coproporphyrinogen III oxidase
MGRMHGPRYLAHMYVHFDPELMSRYDRSGPRYTSYPTAKQFCTDITPAEFAQAALASPGARTGSPLSLYVHIPFCRSPCFYCGCNKVVTRQAGMVDRYVRCLFTEIGLRSTCFDRGRYVEQLHFGGGTPTYLSPDCLAGIMDSIGSHFRLTSSPSRDYSIEIDPRTVDEGYLRRLSVLGFNRVSLGVQDFDSEVQLAINRIQPAALVAEIVSDARACGFRSINFDLIYGLPHQSVASFGATLDRAIEMRPERLAVYGYAHLPRMIKAQRQIRESDLPDAAARLELLQLAVTKLTAAGYLYIGMDHFALPSDSLAHAQASHTLHRNFQGYSTHADRDLVNFGVSSIGHIGPLYLQNDKSLVQYEANLGRGELPGQRGVRTNADDDLRADVIQQLMCYGDIDIATTSSRHDIDFDAYFSAELDRLSALVDDGLVVREPDHIRLTPAGQLLMRVVAMNFDKYSAAALPPAGAPGLQAQQAQQPRHSRLI